MNGSGRWFHQTRCNSNPPRRTVVTNFLCTSYTRTMMSKRLSRACIAALWCVLPRVVPAQTSSDHEAAFQKLRRSTAATLHKPNASHEITWPQAPAGAKPST